MSGTALSTAGKGESSSYRNSNRNSSSRNRSRRTRGPKLDAIVLKPADGKTYAYILSTIRTAVKPEDSGIEDRSIRQTRAGQVLLELKGSTTTARASFSEALKGETDNDNDCTVVKELVPRVLLEIRDLTQLYVRTGDGEGLEKRPAGLQQFPAVLPDPAKYKGTADGHCYSGGNCCEQIDGYRPNKDWLGQLQDTEKNGCYPLL